MTRKVELSQPKFGIIGSRGNVVQINPKDQASQKKTAHNSFKTPRPTSSTKSEKSSIRQLIPSDHAPVKTMKELLQEANDIVSGKKPTNGAIKINEKPDHLITSESLVLNQMTEVHRTFSKTEFDADDESDEDFFVTSKIETNSVQARNQALSRSHQKRKLGKLHYFYCSPDLKHTIRIVLVCNFQTNATSKHLKPSKSK